MTDLQKFSCQRRRNMKSRPPIIPQLSPGMVGAMKIQLKNSANGAICST